MNSLIVSAIVIFLAIIISLYISKKTVDDLKKTEELAQNINLGNDTNIKLSSIKEIRFIQVSLQELSSKLKLKQKGRKKLLDEMIHQTRTPLTILKSHVEAYEDGILELNSSECNILEDQIDNVTSIISNMSEMIEGEKDLEDTGIGIKKEDLKRIFEAYYRGVNTNKIKGEGIGLYVAYENIEAIKGKIEVESKYGIGTKFIIMLPYT